MVFFLLGKVGSDHTGTSMEQYKIIWIYFYEQFKQSN